MLALILAIFVALTPATTNQSKSVKAHIAEFEKLCHCKVEVPITFDTLEPPKVGVCVWFRGPKVLRHIYIDRRYWSEADELDREALIFHELGHCVLNREHEDYFVINPYTQEIMHKSVMSSYVFREYAKYRAYYLYELFQPHITPDDLALFTALK